MADKQIIDFPGTTTVSDSSVFHTHDGGVNKKIDTLSLVTQINERLTYPQSSTTQSGIVQLNNSIDSTSVTQAATANAVRLVNNAVNALSSSLTTVNSQTDPTSGRVLVNNGWMGYGNSILINATHDVLDLPYISPRSNQIFNWNAASRPSNIPPGTSSSGFLQRQVEGSAYEKLIAFDVASNNTYIRNKVANIWGDWVRSLNSSDVTSSPTDTTVDRVVNTQWDFYRAVFSKAAVDKRGSGASVDIADAGNFPVGSICMADSTNGVMPGPGTWSVSTKILSNGSWVVQFAMRIYADANNEEYFFRTGGGYAFTGRPWVPLHGSSSGGIPEAPIDGKQYARKDAGWEEVVSTGGGGDSHRYAPMVFLTASMQVSNNISITLDADQYNFFLVNGWTGIDTPNASGVYNIEIGGLVADPEKIVSGHIHALRLGRKTAVNITAAGFTVNWIAVPTFKNTVTGTDLIHYYISPLRPTVLNLSLVDTRA